jgi:serine/threonine protein kinase
VEAISKSNDDSIELGHANEKCLRGPGLNELILLLDSHILDTAHNWKIRVVHLKEAIPGVYLKWAYPSNQQSDAPTQNRIQSVVYPIMKRLDEDGSDPGWASIEMMEKVNLLYARSGWYERLQQNDSGYFANSLSQDSRVIANGGTAHSSTDQTNSSDTPSPNPATPCVKRRKIEGRASSTAFSSPATPQHIDQLSPMPPKMEVWKCPCRPKPFASKGNLERHQREVHQRPELTFCPLLIGGQRRCSTSMFTKRNLMAHARQQTHNLELSQKTEKEFFEKELEAHTFGILPSYHDKYHDLCPYCMDTFSLQNMQESMVHILGHILDGTNQDFNHRCTRDHPDSSDMDIAFTSFGESVRSRRPFNNDDIGQGLQTASKDDGSDGEDEEDGHNRGIFPGCSMHPKEGRYGTQANQQSTGNPSHSSRGGSAGGRSSSGHCINYSAGGCTEDGDGGLFQTSSDATGQLIFGARVSTSKFDTGISLQRCFKRVRELGRGAFGVVDEVICMATMQRYARKVIPFQQKSSWSTSSEVSILQGLNHFHIIKLSYVYFAEKRLWLITSPVAKSDLSAYLRQSNIETQESAGANVLDRQHLLKWIGCLVCAIEYVHNKGVVHGDIKPKNILISSNEDVYLADFGTARYTQEASNNPATTVSGLTRKYCAPEVIKSLGCLSEWGTAADIFSLGGVFAEMATVHAGLSIQAFESFRSGGTGDTSFHTTIRRTWLWLDHLDVSPDLEYGCPYDFLQVVKDMLSFDPSMRPTVRQLRIRLECAWTGCSPCFDSSFRLDTIAVTNNAICHPNINWSWEPNQSTNSVVQPNVDFRSPYYPIAQVSFVGHQYGRKYEVYKMEQGSASILPAKVPPLLAYIVAPLTAQATHFRRSQVDS